MSRVIFLRIVDGDDGAPAVIAGGQGRPFSGLRPEPRPPAAPQEGHLGHRRKKASLIFE